METTTEEKVIPMDRLAKIYIKIRTAKQELTKKLETEIEALEEQQRAISNAMKDQMQSSGLKSVRTDYGTVVMGTKTRYWTQDWEEFGKFCLAQNSIEFLEKRVAQGNMTKFLEENPGIVPPGLNADTELTISVRKPT